MAILKATILTRVNKICKRSETDIDDILLESLEEISLRKGVLTSLATGVCVADTAYVSAPSDLAGKQIHSFYINTDKPKRQITYSQILNNNIPGYCLYNDKIYLRPTPDGTETYTVDYSAVATDVDSITFPDEFLSLIVRLTAAKLYEKYERYDEVENQIILAEKQYNLLSGYAPVDPVCIYNGQEL